MEQDNWLSFKKNMRIMYDDKDIVEILQKKINTTKNNLNGQVVGINNLNGYKNKMFNTGFTLAFNKLKTDDILKSSYNTLTEQQRNSLGNLEYRSGNFIDVKYQILKSLKGDARYLFMRLLSELALQKIQTQRLKMNASKLKVEVFESGKWTNIKSLKGGNNIYKKFKRKKEK